MFVAYVAVAHAHVEDSLHTQHLHRLLLMNPPGQSVVEVRPQVPTFDIEKHLPTFAGRQVRRGRGRLIDARRGTFSPFPAEPRHTSNAKCSWHASHSPCSLLPKVFSHTLRLLAPPPENSCSLTACSRICRHKPLSRVRALFARDNTGESTPRKRSWGTPPSEATQVSTKWVTHRRFPAELQHAFQGLRREKSDFLRLV